MSRSPIDLDSLTWKKVKYKIYPRTRDQQLLFIALALVLMIAVVAPLSGMIFFSFMPNFPVTEGLGFTLEHYAAVIGQPDLMFSIALNSLIYAGGTTLLAIFIGASCAIFVVKYVQSKWIQVLMLLPYGIPSVASLTGWVLLLGNAGLLTDISEAVFGSAPWDVYSMAAAIFVEGLHTAPIAFLFILPALRAIPAAMDDASFITGANRLRTFRKIILPVIWPSVLSTMIFLFARTMATVATPSVLLLPNQEYTFGSAIPYVFLSGMGLSYSQALSFSVMLTVISAVLIIYYLKVQAKEGKYTTVSGRGRAETRVYETSVTRKFGGYLFVGGYLFIAGFLPLFTVIWNSMLPASTLELEANLAALTLDNYEALFFGNPRGVGNWYRALRNTLLLGVMVPTTAMTISLLIAYSNQMTKMPMGNVLSFFASLPLAIPGIARGVGFLSIFIMTPLWGTWWVLFVAFHGFAIPIGMRYASPALTRVGVENAESSLITGAKSVRTFRKIVLPLVSADFIAGWMHMFVSIIRNVAIPIVLYRQGSEVIAVLLLNVLQQGYFKTASTIAVVISIFSVIPYAVLQYRRVSGDTSVNEEV
jgi:iron(III) transport system permease protein